MESFEANMKAMANFDRSILAGWYVALPNGWFYNIQTIMNFRYLKQKVEEGTARLLIGKFDVKKRAYYGNTSMESEISLLMANQTLVSRLSCFTKSAFTFPYGRQLPVNSSMILSWGPAAQLM
jgi:hypothetical protein